MTVPKIIHYVWLGGGEKKSEHLKNIETWKKVCPDYEIVEWNEKNFDVNCCDFSKEAYERKKFAFVADYMRFKILYEHGGIYIDVDVDVLKPFDEFLKFNSVLGFENSAYLGTGTVISKPKQKWMKEFLDHYETSHFIRGRKFDDDPNTIKVTAFLKKRYGLEITGKRQELKDGITLLPCEYFSAKDFTTGKTEITDNTYAIHQFDGSWTGGKALLFKTLRVIRYVVGRRFFGFLTRTYMKIKAKSLSKIF